MVRDAKEATSWPGITAAQALVFALGLALRAATGHAGADDGRPILDRARKLDQTERRWDDRRQTLTFQLHGPTGERTRELRLFEKRVSDRGRKVLVRFLEPAEVRGLGLLAYTGEQAAQWLFTPELKRIRQISGRAREEHFAGSDLTHNDLDLLAALPGWDAQDAESHTVGEEAVEGAPCHVIELVPKRSDVAYPKIRLWLDRTDLVARRLEFVDANGTVVKRVTQTDIRQVGRIPVPRHVTVETIQAKTRTDILVKETAFDLGLPDECFTPWTLEDVAGESACMPARKASAAAAPRGGDRRVGDRRLGYGVRAIAADGTVRTREVDVLEQRVGERERWVSVRFSPSAGSDELGFLTVMGPDPAHLVTVASARSVPGHVVADREGRTRIAGSDLQYRDLGVLAGLLDAKPTARRPEGKTEDVDDVPCNVVDLPALAGYRRIAVWLGHDDGVPLRVELFEAGDAPAKRITLVDHHMVGEGRVPRRIVIESPASGTRTELTATATAVCPPAPAAADARAERAS